MPNSGLAATDIGRSQARIREHKSIGRTLCACRCPAAPGPCMPHCGALVNRLRPWPLYSQTLLDSSITGPACRRLRRRPLPPYAVRVISLRPANRDHVVDGTRGGTCFALGLQSANLVPLTIPAVIIPGVTLHDQRLIVHREPSRDCQIPCFVTSTSFTVVCVHRRSIVLESLAESNALCVSFV